MDSQDLTIVIATVEGVFRVCMSIKGSIRCERVTWADLILLWSTEVFRVGLGEPWSLESLKGIGSLNCWKSRQKSLKSVWDVGKGIGLVCRLGWFCELCGTRYKASSYFFVSLISFETPTLPDCRICPKLLVNHQAIIFLTNNNFWVSGDQLQALITSKPQLSSHYIFLTISEIVLFKFKQ